MMTYKERQALKQLARKNPRLAQKLANAMRTSGDMQSDYEKAFKLLEEANAKTEAAWRLVNKHDKRHGKRIETISNDIDILLSRGSSKSIF